jgi:ABC-type long-subunit fatty acid transport system fused permease/ATPase subunit
LQALATASLVRTKQTLIEATISSTYTSYINSVYSTAFVGPSGTAYYDVISAFKTMYLGPTSDPTKITGIIKSKLTAIFNDVNSALDHMILSWKTLHLATQPNVKAEITSVDSAILNLKTKL